MLGDAGVPLRTFGTLAYEAALIGRGSWVLRCEPHVMLRLRRVFQRISEQHQGCARLQDGLDIARDLEWFIERYPLEMDADTELRLRTNSQRYQDQISIVASILAGASEPMPVDVARPLRPYQRTAADLAFVRKRLLLADDVGLGKTTSAIGLIVRPECRPAVVVTLTHLPLQWESEIAVVAPQLRTHVIRTTTVYDITRPSARRNVPGLFGMPDVVLVSYSKLAAWAETLAPLMKSVVFDEVQELRHSGTAKHAAGQHLSHNADYALGLSATPFYNYGGEMHSVMSALVPDSLGTFEEFSTQWCVRSYEERKARIADPVAFGSYLREGGLMLRRTRKDVDRELPGGVPLKIPQMVESDPEALKKVSRSCAELAEAILRHGEQYRGEKMQASEEFSAMLRQATGIGKAPYVAEFVRLLVESGEKVLLYGWHREVYRIWQEKLADLTPVLYTGTESVPQKEEAKRRFLDGESSVLIVSLRSGAGLDGLQYKCRTVVIGELDWSPGVIEQCIGRVFRDGQTDHVAVYYMLSNEGADPFMSEVLGLKRSQIDGLRDGEAELIEELQTDAGNVKRMAAAYLEKLGMSVEGSGR